MLRKCALALLLGLSPAWAQPEDPRPQELPKAPPEVRRPTLPPTSPLREAVWLFDEAKRLHRQGAIVRAVDTYRRALARDPGRLEYRPYLAVALDQLGNYPEAKEQYDLYLKLEPNDQRIRLQRTATLIHAGDFEEATKELGVLKLYGSAMPLYHDMVGLLALRQNRYADAVVAYQTVLSQDSSRVDTRINLAQAYLLLNQPDKAKEQLDIAFKGGAKEAVLNNLGVLQTRTGDYTAAQKLFEQAWGPPAAGALGLPEALLNLATVLAQQNKTRDALLTVAKLLDLQSDNVDAQILYSRLLARSGRLPEARKEIDKVVALGPEVLAARWPYVCEISGLIFLEMDDNEAARGELEKAILALPKSVSARHNLAMALGRMGALDDAIAEELTAHKLAPENKAVLYHLGVLYDLDARPKLAIETYQKFLKLAGDDPEAEGLREHVAELQAQLAGKPGQPIPKAPKR